MSVASDVVVGYTRVTKVLHWLTVLALIAQFILGYGLKSLSEWWSEAGYGGSGGEDADEALVFAHAWLGLAIMALTVIRLVWRRATPLPPWSERLSATDRLVETWLERLLYGLLFVVPGTGLALLYLSGEERETHPERDWQPPYDLADDDLLLTAHIAGHLLLYAAVAGHVWIALRRRTLGRML